MEELNERNNEMNELIKHIEFLVNYFQLNNEEFDDYNYIYDLESSIKRFIDLYYIH